MGMIDQIIDFNKSFVTQEVYEKHLYIFIFIALFYAHAVITRLM